MNDLIPSGETKTEIVKGVSTVSKSFFEVLPKVDRETRQILALGFLIGVSGAVAIGMTKALKA